MKQLKTITRPPSCKLECKAANIQKQWQAIFRPRTQ